MTFEEIGPSGGSDAPRRRATKRRAAEAPTVGETPRIPSRSLHRPAKDDSSGRAATLKMPGSPD